MTWWLSNIVFQQGIMMTGPDLTSGDSGGCVDVCMYEYCELKWKQWKGKHIFDELNYNTNLRSLLFYCIVYLQYILIYIMYWYTFCIRIAINHKPRCIYYTFMYFTNQIPATRHYHQKLIPWMIVHKGYTISIMVIYCFVKFPLSTCPFRWHDWWCRGWIISKWFIWRWCGECY